VSAARTLLGLTLALWSLTAVALSAAETPALVNPSVTIAPVPNFLDSGQCLQSSPHAGFHCSNPCLTSTPSWPTPSDNHRACTRYVLSALNRARQLLHEPALSLPTNWCRLTTPQQLFVILNLERTSLGFAPYLGLNAALSITAQRAAEQRQDPGPARGFPLATNADGTSAIGAAWSEGFSVLVADYGWMYDDGWAGSRDATMNIDCTSATAPACWAHRDELLGSDPGYNPAVGLDCATCEVGTGFAVVAGNGSYTDLIERPVGPPPAMTFTWAKERPFLTTHFPSPSVTTTTVQTAPAVAIASAAVGGKDVLVHWQSTFTVATSELDVFLGGVCGSLIDRITSTYAPPTTSGVINVTIPLPSTATFFTTGSLYSMRILTPTPLSKVVSSPCVRTRAF